MKYTARVLFALAAIFSIAATPIQCQEHAGNMVGIVTDPSGAIVPNAQVEAINQGTGLALQSATNSSGLYTINAVPIGRYTVTVRVTGFQTSRHPDIPVVSGETVTLDVELVVGQTTETVDVTAAPPVLDTTTTTNAISRTNQELKDLPITLYGNSSRSAISLIKTFTGVSYDPAESGGQEFMVMSRASINGTPAGKWAYNIDGVEAGPAFSGERGHDMQAPTPDMIQEVRVTANADASSAFTPGVTVELTEKSGTNDFHGSVYEYFRNKVLDARSFFLPDTTQDSQNNYGFAAGGPVIIPHVYNGKDKTFFFVNWDMYRFRTTNAGVQQATFGSVATTKMRNGDFSELLGPQVGTDALGRPIFQGAIYDPTTTQTLPGGEIVRDPFPGNIIDPSLLSPISTAILGDVALPNLPGTSLNWVGPNTQTRVDKDQLFMKFDQIINDANRFTFAYERLTPWTLFQEQGVATGLSGHSFLAGGPGFLGPAMSQAFIDDRDQYRYRFNYVWTAKSNMVMSFRMGVQGTPNRVIAWFPQTGTTATFGRDIGLTGTLDPRAPLVNIQSFSQLGGFFGKSTIPVYTVPGYLDVNWTKGRHNFKFGVNYMNNKYILKGGFFTTDYGNFSFLARETGLPGYPETGSGMASFALGWADSATVQSPPNTYTLNSAWGLYAQDDWRVTPKLTLNIGLRWDYYAPTYEHQDKIGSFDPTLSNPGAGGLPGALTIWGSGTGRNGLSRLNEPYYRAFGPHLGFAYSLNPKTVFRGSFGIGYGPSWDKWIGNIPSPGFTASLTSASVDNGVTPAFNWENGVPLTFPQLPFLDPTLLNGSSITYINRADNRPTMYENVGFEVARELPGDMTIRLSYVGTFAHRIPTGGLDNLNVLPISAYSQYGSLLTENINSPAAQAAGIPVPYAGFNGSVAQALLPFPQYLSVPYFGAPVGNSSYNAAQVYLQKRVGHDLSFLVAYSAAKNLTNSFQFLNGQGGATVQHPEMKGTAKALDAKDRPQELSISWTYELPFGRGKRFGSKASSALNGFIGGWKITGIQTYFSGTPIRVSTQASVPFASVWPIRVAGQSFGATSCGDYDPGDPSSDRYLNIDAFDTPAPFTFGNISQLPNLRNCGYMEEDFGIDKEWRFQETKVIRFGSLFQNAFNRHPWRTLQTDINNPSAFGKYSDTYPGRNIQFYMRFEF